MVNTSPARPHRVFTSREQQVWGTAAKVDPEAKYGCVSKRGRGDERRRWRERQRQGEEREGRKDSKNDTWGDMGDRLWEGRKRMMVNKNRKDEDKGGRL